MATLVAMATVMATVHVKILNDISYKSTEPIFMKNHI